MENKKQCQNCKKYFLIEEDDIAFCKKIQVPPPTFCPECRMIRRMVWRNQRSLYKRECGLCNKTLVSMYPDDGVKIFCDTCFNGDDWNQFEFAQDLDWSKTFLEQLYNLFRKQPRVFQYRIGTVVNSDYGNSVVNSKNVYLGYSVLDSEDVSYSENIDKSKNSMDCLSVQKLDQCYWNINSQGNYNSHFIIDSENCIDSFFLFDCVNCQHCCLSSNIRNQQYVFKNEKLSKEEYTEKVKSLHLETNSGFLDAQSQFNEVFKNSIHRFANILSSQNVTGDIISNSKNVFKSFDVKDSEEIKYSYRIIKSKDVRDCCWTLSGELEYETNSGTNGSYNQIACMLCFSSTDMKYSLFCKNSSNCFGCVGLKNAHYCILNKQYSKEEYLILIEKIKEHMKVMPYIDSNDRVYLFGEFFPYEFSPFGYNETSAHDFFPIKQSDALSNGFNWKDRDKREHGITMTEVPDSILDVTDDILKEVFGCPNEGNQDFQCTTAFRITESEFRFYQQKKLPLPRYCPNCRHYQRLLYRNPMRLYRRECMNGCGNTFETSYAPDDYLKVYCESCYQKAVL